MKYTIKLFILGLIVILAGCSPEPMIKISEENLASLEAKQSQANDSDESTVEETPTEAAPESVEETLTALDPSQWTRLPDESVFAIADYMPYYANQMKQFTGDQGNFTTYVDYLDTTQQLMQVSQMIQGQTHVQLYRWDQNQIQQVWEQENTQPFENYVLSFENQPDNTLTLLSAPLTVGTTWSYDGTKESRIVALYEQVTLAETAYTNVVEVSTDFEEYQLHHYYAAGDGLILTRQIPKEGQATAETVSQVAQNYHNVMKVTPIEIAAPQVGQTNLLAMETVDFSWQTNDTLASAFDRLFTEQGWITEAITVNRISVTNDVATIDFSPGVVAAINSHPATEQGVIPAIIMTLANFYDVSQVSLTVNGNGLLPNTMTYPDNGIYTVDESWLTGTTVPPNQAPPQTQTPAETPAADQTIELSIPTEVDGSVPESIEN